MAHYVMSDIHGEGSRFYAMLERIGFSSADNLYILGDVIDRGGDGVALLRQILATRNMTLLLGNHEQMMLEYYRPGATFIEILRWNRNGNAPTVAALDQLREKHLLNLLADVKELPDHMEVEVDGCRFHLVHGFPGDTRYSRVWTRPDYFAANPIPDATLIVGHTPVVAYSAHEPVRDHFRILHAPGFIDIDCGCGHSSEQRRLACLRLEDMQEFYC